MAPAAPALLLLLALDLAVANPGSPEEAVRTALEARLGPQPELSVEANAHGRVQLPLAERYTAERLAEEWTREGLDTPARREKAEVGRGPGQLWTHFLGSDVAGTDCWADPAFLVAFVHLAADWQAHCTGELGGQPDHCALMVGDIAYTHEVRPDPLGHRDHYRGDCVDLRLWRTDGSRYEAFWNRADDRPGRGLAYDAATTRAFVTFAAARPETRTLLFNDPEAQGASPARGHDDHIHLCLGAPAATSP